MKANLLRSPEGEEGTPKGEAPPAAAAVTKSSAKETDAADAVKLKQDLEEERSKNKELQKKLEPKPTPTPAPAKGGLNDWLF